MAERATGASGNEAAMKDKRVPQNRCETSQGCQKGKMSVWEPRSQARMKLQLVLRMVWGDAAGRLKVRSVPSQPIRVALEMVMVESAAQLGELRLVR